jgi:hypothetical protein
MCVKEVLFAELSKYIKINKSLGRMLKKQSHESLKM